MRTSVRIASQRGKREENEMEGKGRREEEEKAGGEGSGQRSLTSYAPTFELCTELFTTLSLGICLIG